MNRSRIGKLGIVSALVGGLAAAGTPAVADTYPQSPTATVTYSATQGTSNRTLQLLDTKGNQLSNLDLSQGAGAFIARVKDPGVDPALVGNFNVQATMTNLYRVTATDSNGNPTSFDCSTFIKSGDISLDSLPSLLGANSLSDALQPVFTIQGSLTNLVTGIVGLTNLAGLSKLNLNPSFTIDGAVATVDQLAQSGVADANTVVGDILSNGKLPINLTSQAGGTFDDPDAPPASFNCPLASGSPAATPRPVMQGTLNGVPTSSSGTLSGPLLTDLHSQLTPSSPVLATLLPAANQPVGPGQIDPTLAEQDIEYYTGLPASMLDPLGLYPTLLSQIESTLTASVTGVVDAVTQLSGTYEAEPHMSIEQSGAVPGSYRGVLTVTMTQG